MIKIVNFEELANFQPKQLEAWYSLFTDYKYFLYGGAAAGGKSYLLRWAALGLGLYYHKKYGIKNVPIGLFSEDYPTLKDRQARRIQLEFPAQLGELRDTQTDGFAFIGKNDSFAILLRNLDDPSKYASTEFAAECVEELTKNPRETFDDLRFRLRYPGIPDPKFLAATNPGGIGHAWVKEKWIDKNPTTDDKESHLYFYIPAKVTDNQYVDPSYIKQLESLPEQKRKAFLDGSWDVFAGQVFTEWSRDTHVVKPFIIPSDWKTYGALDLGWNNPMSVGWYAVDHDGRTYLFKEWYGNADWFKNKFGKELTAQRLARLINASSSKMKRENNIPLPEYWVGDPAIWNRIIRQGDTDSKHDIEGESYAEIMINAGLNLIAGDNNRMNGLNRYREALAEAPDGKPWYQVFETCYDTIRTIPSLIYDEHRIEDVDTDGEDHCFDRDKYFFMSRPSATLVKPKAKSSIIQKAYARAKYEYNHEDDQVSW